MNRVPNNMSNCTKDDPENLRYQLFADLRKLIEKPENQLLKLK